MLSSLSVNTKKVSHLCAREVRRVLFRGSHILREHPHRARRSMRDMLSFWKKHEREEKDLRKRAEKQAIEAKKAEEEAREVRRQARKLDFLINQTELYSHFMASKLDKTDTEKTALLDTVGLSPNSHSKKSLDQLFREDDTENILMAKAKEKAMAALHAQDAQLRSFDAKREKMTSSDLNDISFLHPTSMPSDDDDGIPQPSILRCTLKGYQRKGLAWLANLYDQGINGILADEMGLGKTVQSISLLAHLSERHNIWGPFLIVTPASTLHNWQQELERFVPSFKAIPYWGSPTERKILRSFWTSRGNSVLGTRDAPFHVLITSYQLIVADEKYFSKMTWQYMVLDEAQAIKSSSSARWKILLGQKARNRLLLTGTPIQNSMAELWALLHFIMPTLFDSHDEFSAWFSKDIESHVTSSTNRSTSTLDAHQLRRLHMVLKPFMLRRMKRDVESELADKIEIDVPCIMTPRQRVLYSWMKRQLSRDKVFEKIRGTANLSSSSTSVDSHLMNLMMQFRKVCNHPELLIPSAITSPFIANRSFGGLLDFVGPSSSSFLDISLPKLLLDIPSETLEKGSFIQRHVNVVKERIESDKLHIQTRSNAGIILDISGDLSWRNLDEMYIPKAIAPCAPAIIVSDRRWSWECAFTNILPPLLLEFLGVGTSLQGLRNSIFKKTNVDPLIYAGTPLLYRKAPLSIPHSSDLITGCGKMDALCRLLGRLKKGGHRVLVYFQMTRMIDLMEDVLKHLQLSYLRLDGSSKISDRRDMVSDWQSNDEIFCFLLSTRAGGLGINLTAADTVVFYDSDWNPTVDQQAMDRAHRLGQTKQVTVYRLITTGTIEERIQQRAREKHEIQKVVIADGGFQPTSPLSHGIAGEEDQPTTKDLASILMMMDGDEEDVNMLSCVNLPCTANQDVSMEI